MSGLGSCSCPCDLWTDWCPRGEKCAPHSDIGDAEWDCERCVELDPQPGAPGDPCTVHGEAGSGHDTCDRHAVCWNVDPQILEGTCLAMCQGSPDDPICPAGSGCRLYSEALVPLCFPLCHPLMPDCNADEVCLPAYAFSSGGFVCLPVTPPLGELFEPCEYPGTCTPGLACVESESAAECDPIMPGCCLPWCDTTLPDCPPTLQCLPWYEFGQPPAGLEHLGVCRLMP